MGTAVGDFELQFVQRAVQADLLNFEFFDAEFVDGEVAGNVEAADQFAGWCGWDHGGGATEQGGKQALQPAGARSWASPAIEFGGVEFIGVELRGPGGRLGVLRTRGVRRVRIGGRVFGDGARPGGAEALRGPDQRGALAVVPFETSLL